MYSWNLFASMGFPRLGFSDSDGLPDCDNVVICFELTFSQFSGLGLVSECETRRLRGVFFWGGPATIFILKRDCVDVGYGAAAQQARDLTLGD